MKIQITLFAFGWSWGRPSGGGLADSWAAMPSRKSAAPRARPVKPIPVSARKPRRVRPLQFIGSPDGDEIVVVEEHVHQALPRSVRVVERAFAFLALGVGGRPTQDALEGASDEVRLGLERELKPMGHVEGQGAVGERDGLGG